MRHRVRSDLPSSGKGLQELQQGRLETVKVEGANLVSPSRLFSLPLVLCSCTLSGLLSLPQF